MSELKSKKLQEPRSVLVHKWDSIRFTTGYSMYTIWLASRLTGAANRLLRLFAGALNRFPKKFEQRYRNFANLCFRCLAWKHLSVYLHELQLQRFFDFQILSDFKNVTNYIFRSISKFPQVSDYLWKEYNQKSRFPCDLRRNKTVCLLDKPSLRRQWHTDLAYP